MNIDRFLQEQAALPFVWGETDCVSTVDRWIRLNKGFSPLVGLGLQYHSQEDAERMLSDHGGFALAINRTMRRTGFVKTTTPQQGDIAIVIHNAMACLSIHAGSFYFSRHESGMIGASLHSVWKAWRL